MMRCLGVLLTWLILGGAAAAQNVTIRSGEHENYSRLVLTVPSGAEWSISDEERRPVLGFERPFRFDTGDVFDRIPRNRLTALRQIAPGRLRLELACACDVSVFWHDQTRLVVDIADPVPEPDIDRARARPVRDDLNEASGETPAGPSITPQTYWPRTSPSAALAQRRLAPSAPEGEPDVPEAQLETELRQAEALDRKRQQIMEQLGRAASQGLLSPKAAWPDKASPQAEKPERPLQETSTPRDADEPPSYMHNTLDNIRAQSSVDRDFLRHVDSSTGITGDGRECLPEALVRVSDWGSEAPFGRQIGPLNKRLYGEFDKPNEGTALQLARLYVFFGFGAEARRTLRLVETPSRDRDIALAMAQILQNGKAPEESPFAGQLDCTTSVALWAALANPELPANTPVNADAVLRGLAALPVHLRRYLGPGLSERFLDADRPETANRILRILDRGTKPDTPDIGMAKAEAKLAEGAIKEAAATLDQVVEQSAEPSARALVRRVETLWRDEREISFEMAQLAAAYASENRETEIYEDLLWAQVVALAGSGAFHQAFDEIDRIEEKGVTAREGLVNDVMKRLAARAEDFDFLQYALPPEQGEVPILSPAVANATAARLLDLGFADAAGAYLQGGVRAPHDRQRQILRARLALQKGRARQAEAELLGLTGQDVNLLRAKARSRLGQHRAASELFASVGQNEDAELQAWLAEDWDQLATGAEASTSKLAEFMTNQAQEPKPDLDTGQLRQGRDLLGQSGEVRDMLRKLLEVRGLAGGDS